MNVRASTAFKCILLQFFCVFIMHVYNNNILRPEFSLHIDLYIKKQHVFLLHNDNLLNQGNSLLLKSLNNIFNIS